MLDRVWLAAFGVFFALSATWSLSTPLGSAVDEVGHMTWAAAVADGQFDPPRQYVPADNGGVEDRYLRAQVRVPEFLDALNGEIVCYAFRPGTPASCAEPLKGSGTEVASTTPMAVYNPAYYALVGWPVRLVDGLPALYAMRLLSALLCAALLATAASVARRVHRIAFAGVAVGATPMALYLSGSVNPNGVEAAGGLLAWTALAALALDPRPELIDRRFGYFALGASVLTLARSAGIVWLAMLLVMAAILTRRSIAAQILRRRAVRIAACVLALCAVLGEIWNHFLGGLNLSPSGRPTTFTAGDALSSSFHELPSYVQQMIGYFGWLDTPPPFGTVVAWIALVGVLVLSACALAGRRELATLLLLLAGVVAIPLAANAYQSDLGDLWQGRYLLWWVAGMPVVAGMVLSVRAERLPRLLVRRLPVVIACVVAAGQLGMFWSVALRFGVGLGGRLYFLHPHWSPPISWPGGVLIMVAGLTGLILVSLPAREGRSGDQGGEDEVPDTSATVSGGQQPAA